MTDNRFNLALDIRRATREGPEGLRRRQHQRLTEMITFARQHSPYYHELYTDVPAQVTSATQLPATPKRELMENFDEWTTDRGVSYDELTTFLDDPTAAGDRFAGRYLVCSTSGPQMSEGGKYPPVVPLLDGSTLRSRPGDQAGGRRSSQSQKLRRG